MPNGPASRSWNLPAWLAVIGALGGALVFGMPKASDKAGDPAAAHVKPDPLHTASQPAAEDDKDDPLIVLRDFASYGYDPPAVAKASLPFERIIIDGDGFTVVGAGEGPSGQRPARPDLVTAMTRIKNARYEFLIVSVPDPVDSKFAFEFDALVESIQRAFEARGFILQSSWLPWPRTNQEKKSDRNTKIKYRDLPGTLLFRHVRDTGNDEIVFALVCLIGENPISGVHKKALTRALSIRGQLVAAIAGSNKAIAWSAEQAAPENNKEVVPIVGPYFSGSQEGFSQTLLEANLNRDPGGNTLRFKVISGSASSINSRLFCRTSDITVQATVAPSEELFRAAVQFLKGNHGRSLNKEAVPTNGFALLRESNTGFGAKSSYAKVCRDDTSDATPSVLANMVDLPFPASISRLHINLDKLEAGLPPPPALPQTEPAGPTLPARGQSLDGISPFDDESAAAVAYQSLQSILAAIQREQIRYVGILATDSRDVIFLNKLIRTHCRHVRVFAIEPAASFLQQQDAYHMRGMLTASTYPLYLAAQKWAGKVRGPGDGPAETNDDRQKPLSKDVRLAFPTQSCQGTYNAILAHFGCDAQSMIGYRPPAFSTLPADSKPPIWISVIGENNTLMPVHFYKMDDEDGYMVESKWPPSLAAVDISFGTVVVHVLAALMLLYALLSLIKNWSSKGDNVWALYLANRQAPWHAWAWRWVITAGALLCILPYAFTANECWRPSCSSNGLGHWTVGVAVAVNIGLLAAGILLMIRFFWGSRFWPFLIIGANVLFAVGSLHVWLGSEEPQKRFLFYVRCLDVDAGLSAVVPLTLLGLAAIFLGSYSLRQAELSGVPWLGCPFPDDVKDVANKYRRLERTSEFWPLIFRSPGLATLLIAAVAAITITIIFRALPSDEIGAWDVLVLVIAVALILAVVLTLLRFLNLWKLLQSYLDAFRHLPMAHAFKHLPSAVQETFDFYQFRGRPRPSEMGVLLWMLPPGGRGRFAKVEAEADHLYAGLTEQSHRYARCLRSLWQARTVEEAFGWKPVPAKAEPRPSEATASLLSLNVNVRWPAEEGHSAAEQQELFVAAVAVIGVGGYFAQLRSLLYAMVIAAPLLLLAGASYPFQPERPPLFMLSALTMAVAASVLYVLVSINRNYLLSRLHESTPERFTPDLDFLSSVLLYVGPLIGVLVAHFLGLFRPILDPLFAMLR